MVTLEAVSSSKSIEKPRAGRFSEFEVQATLYTGLLFRSVDVRGEVVKEFPRVKGQMREKCRFDLVIFYGERAIRILEVKGDYVKHKNGVENTRQGRRYPQFGVPVTFIYGMNEAKQFLADWDATNG